MVLPMTAHCLSLLRDCPDGLVLPQDVVYESSRFTSAL